MGCCSMHKNSLFCGNLDKCPLPISKVLENAGWDALLEDKKSSKDVIRRNLSFIITWGCCPKILNEKVEYSPKLHGIDIAESIPGRKQPCLHTGTIQNVGGSWGSASMQFQHLTEEALCATPKHVPVFAQQRCITFSRISDLGNVGRRESKMLPNSTCVQQRRSIEIFTFRLWPSHSPCYIYPQKIAGILRVNWPMCITHSNSKKCEHFNTICAHSEAIYTLTCSNSITNQENL